MSAEVPRTNLPQPPSVPEIAVTVIGGYLGAGKTTMVNHILRCADETVAVLVNDFGEINIDQDLIASHDGETISLSNGCICCSMVDGFSAALETVLATSPRPQRLVIEASGVADPATVASYGHGPGLRLDATVVVVDAETVIDRSDDVYVGDTVLGQLRSADIVVLNKTDLVDSHTTDRTRNWLTERCGEAVIVDSIHGAVDPALLFGVQSPNGATRSSEAVEPLIHAESMFESWIWTSDVAQTRLQLEAMMHDLPKEVVRCKGLVLIEEEPDTVMILQRIGQRWTLRPFGPRDGNTSRLLVIGLRGAISDLWLDSYLTS